jgi:hypothetical protein
MDPLRLKALQLVGALPPYRAPLLHRGHASPSELDRIGRQTSPDAARWAATQWDLRRRAMSKFERGREMLFTREALEQASHERIAAWHASRFPAGRLVADLTCGIGGDLIALAARGTAIGFELDAERAGMARHNLALHGMEAEVRVADSLASDWEFEYAGADPARRVEGRRTLDPSEFEPSPLELALRFQRLRLGGMKLTPMLPDEFLARLGPRLEFVSLGGECREVVAWSGSEAEAGRVAVHVESGETLGAADAPGGLQSPGRYLYEADPAAIRAHALGTLCRRFHLSPLGTSNGYLTADAPCTSPWIDGFEVVYSGKADLKATRLQLRELDARVQAVKVRGVRQEPELLRRQLKSDGADEVALVVYPVGKSVRHALVKPLARTSH